MDYLPRLEKVGKKPQAGKEMGQYLRTDRNGDHSGFIVVSQIQPAVDFPNATLRELRF